MLSLLSSLFPIKNASSYLLYYHIMWILLFLIDLRGHPVRLPQQLPTQKQSILTIDTWGYYSYDEIAHYSLQQQQHDPQQPQNEKDRILEIGKSICCNDEEKAKHIFGIHERQKVFIQHTRVCPCTGVCVFVRTCVFVCVYICTYIHVFEGGCVFVQACVFVCVCIFVCTCVREWVCICTGMCVCLCAYLYYVNVCLGVDVYLYRHVCLSVCVRIFVRMCVCVHLNVCMYVNVCVSV